MEKYFLTPEWSLKFDKLKCGFTVPVSGNQALHRKSISSGRSNEENRKFLADVLGIDVESFFYPRQIHSSIVIPVDDAKRGLGALTLDNALEGDACITNEKNVLLITTWADCIPIVLYDPVTGWIASVHSGWRGALSNVIGETISVLQNYGVDNQRLLAAVGPGIRGCCYQVGDEFRTNFSGTIMEECLSVKDNSLYFDLNRGVYLQLCAAGIMEENIDFSGLCTCCSNDPVFFSCRKDGKDFEAQAAFIGVFE